MWTPPIEILLARDYAQRQAHPDDLARATRMRGQELTRLRDGVYVRTRDFNALTPGQRHRTRVHVMQLVANLGSHTAFARESAALVYGLPLIGTIPEQVQLVKTTRRGGRQSRTSRTLTAPQGSEIVEVDGLRITSVRQTLVDLGRRSSFACSLACIDQALRLSMTSKDALFDLLEQQPGVVGNGRLRKAIDYADARSESPGESLSRAVMIEHHIPMPELQFIVYDADGVLVGRVDFAWPEFKVVGEFDGRVKYGREMSGRPLEDVILAERRREIEIEAASRTRMVRWMWADAWNDGGRRMLDKLAREGVRPMK